MTSFSLAEIQTADKLIHQGIFFKPSKSRKKAILWVHGLGGNFYSNVALWKALSVKCDEYGYGFAAFNNRGHHLVSGIRKIDTRKKSGYTHVNGGAGYEDFAHSMFDIEAGIEFLVKQGFSQVILIGHSTGANKVCYFAGSGKNKYLTGVVLASPLSDRLDTALDQEKLQKDLRHMRALIKQGKGDELQLGYHFFPMTPKRFVNLFTANSLEDQFDYGDKKPKFKYFSGIKLPILIILGSVDEYLDRPAEKVIEIFDKKATSKKYNSMILPNVLHSYHGSEALVVTTICSWISGLPSGGYHERGDGVRF